MTLYLLPKDGYHRLVIHCFMHRDGLYFQAFTSTGWFALWVYMRGHSIVVDTSTREHEHVMHVYRAWVWFALSLINLIIIWSFYFLTR